MLTKLQFLAHHSHSHGCQSRLTLSGGAWGKHICPLKSSRAQTPPNLVKLGGLTALQAVISPMLKLEYTENTGMGYRHRAWAKVGEARYQPSPLQNQFALSEYGLSEAEALARFRPWLWGELQDGYNVVSKELKALARAHLAGQAVEVLVPKAAPHGQVIIDALSWLANHRPPRTLPVIATAAPAPCYEPILPDGVLSTRAEIDANHLVWVQGNTSSRIGVIVGYNEVLVPGYGVLPLKQFHWARAKLAASPLLQEHLNDALDALFEQEAAETPVEYDPAPPYDAALRYSEEEFWAQTTEEEIDQGAALVMASRDAMTQVEQLAAELDDDVETALEIAQLPDVAGWFYKRPPTPLFSDASNMRPVYQYSGEDQPLRVKSVADQVADRPFRFATQAEAAHYVTVFRQPRK